jgi:hypothetical protein
MLPLNALKLWSMIRKEKEPSKDIDEILDPKIRSQIKGELDKGEDFSFISLT